MFVAIIPAFNEEKRIEQVVGDLKAIVDEVIVVDDASTDDTVTKAKNAGATLLCLPINRGQGAALQTGGEYALDIGAEYVLHFDGDAQFCVEDVLPAFEKIKKEKADILFGSRYLDGRSNVPKLKKYFIHPVGKLLDRVLFNVSLSDAHNGFRILNRKALGSIEISQDRMAHATEIPKLAVKKNLQIVEFPVKVVYHEFGQGLKGGFRILRDLFFQKLIG